MQVELCTAVYLCSLSILPGAVDRAAARDVQVGLGTDQAPLVVQGATINVQLCAGDQAQRTCAAAACLVAQGLLVGVNAEIAACGHQACIVVHLAGRQDGVSSRHDLALAVVQLIARAVQCEPNIVFCLDQACSVLDGIRCAVKIEVALHCNQGTLAVVPSRGRCRHALLPCDHAAGVVDIRRAGERGCPVADDFSACVVESSGIHAKLAGASMTDHPIRVVKHPTGGQSEVLRIGNDASRTIVDSASTANACNGVGGSGSRIRLLDDAFGIVDLADIDAELPTTELRLGAVEFLSGGGGDTQQSGCADPGLSSLNISRRRAQRHVFTGTSSGAALKIEAGGFQFQ